MASQLRHYRRVREVWTAPQPHRVGSFSGGAADLQGGAHIYFKCEKTGEQTKAGGAAL